jgi:protein-disulfide isomerase
MSVSLRTALPIVTAMLLASPALAQNSAVQPNQTPVPAETPAAGGFSPDQTRAIENIVKDYLVQHPEVLQDAMDALDKRQKEADAEKARTTIKDNKATIFNSAHQVVLGNPDGNVTMVEFFDYNCAYCKRALPDMLSLLKTDPDLKFVLKEFPVLGPGSVEAAHVAVASSTKNCSADEVRPTKRARWRSPRMSDSTWRGSKRT